MAKVPLVQPVLESHKHQASKGPGYWSTRPGSFNEPAQATSPQSDGSGGGGPKPSGGGCGGGRERPDPPDMATIMDLTPGDRPGVTLAAIPQPLIDTVKSALQLLLHSNNDPKLEIGVSATVATPTTGHFCAIRAPRDDASLENLHLAADNRLVFEDGDETGQPYPVFSIVHSDRRDDWTTIPDLYGRYEEIRTAARKGDLPGAQAVLGSFGQAAVFCPDLLARDRQRLRDLVAAEVALAFPDVSTGNEPINVMPDLSLIPLYG